MLNGALQSLGRQNVVRFRPNKLYRTLWPSGIGTSQEMLFGCQRSICTEHGLGLDNVPDVRQCLVVEAVQVENLAFVVVDVARWGVRLQSAVDGYLWGIRTHAMAVDFCTAAIGQQWRPPCGASDRKALCVGLARYTHRDVCNVWSTRSALVDQNFDGVLI